MSSGDLTYGFPQRTYFLWRDGSETVGANIGIGKYFIKFYHNSATIDRGDLRDYVTVPFSSISSKTIYPACQFFFFFSVCFVLVFLAWPGWEKALRLKLRNAS